MIDANSQFFAILTNVGMAKQANADALGIPWKFTEMGVGDANGTDPIPSATQTQLINEWRRRPLNQVRVDPVNPAVIIAEQIIPADEGGHWIREIGLYDAAGDLVAVANCAPSFKPLMSQGSGRTQVVRMNFIVSSTGNITLKIDPAVVLATREYVDQRIMEEVYKLDSKQSVRVATTANIALAGLQAVDGVALVAGDRVLVKNQAGAKDNGLYVVSAGAWARTADADANAEVTSAMLVSVEQGATLADTRWQLITDGAIALGTTPLTFQNVTQGFAPINSPALVDPSANTPPLFDSSKSLATTEFVARSAGSFGGSISITASRVLTVSDIGKRLELATGVTVTLPATESVPNGAAVLISAGPQSATSRVAVAAGDQLAMNNLAVAVPYTLSPGGDFIAIRESNVWRCHFGSETLRNALIFAASLQANGYQKLPSGLIIQWGYRTTSALSNVYTTDVVTFPIAFPQATLFRGGSFGSGADSTWLSYTLEVTQNPRASMTIRAASGSPLAGQPFSWVAIGL
ncbi:MULTISPECIES: phage tail protein [unclassified Pseudomonas]|uniref:phage tail protein n=2 Tax=Pseudomonas TaxID=286 RepID=UPI001CA786C6|nr:MULTISPECIES: phage tail protein [unclassified Pseudomonas]MBY8971832.1 phage tail protein [Pseudomonas sp. P867]MCK3864651.1 phage tail protein [Pseudomonas sp. B329]